MLRIIIESGLNVPPEAKIQKRIDELGEGWKVQSATTQMLGSTAVWEDAVQGQGTDVRPGVPKHVFYATTVVLEKTV